MAYTLSNNVVAWKGKRIVGAEAASFTVALPIVAYDANQVYVLGKPVTLDRASFEVLSPCYVRDRNGVYCVMESKLKQITGAHIASFEAIGVAHGRDQNTAWFHDKRIRLSKGGNLAALRELSPEFCSDGRWVYFGTKEQENSPAPESIDLKAARMRSFEDSDGQCRLLVLGDGAQVIVRHDLARFWVALQAADFDSLAAFDVPNYPWTLAYLQDNTHVWYENQLLSGVHAKEARLIGRQTLAVGQQVYSGADLTTLRADELCYLSAGAVAGDHFQTGQSVIVLNPGAPPHMRPVPVAQPVETAVTLAFTPVFHILFSVFDAFLPIENSPYRILFRLGLKTHARVNDSERLRLPPVPMVDMPVFRVRLQPDGMVVLRLSTGAELTEPASGWYTLACRFWAAERGRDERFLPYPCLGNKSPSGDELVREVLQACADDMLGLAVAVLSVGAETEARVLAHQLLVAAEVCKDMDDPLSRQRMAALPMALVAESYYMPLYITFQVTTILGMARHILKQGLLEHSDWRIRLEMAAQIHWGIYETGQLAHFYEDVMPAVMLRYDVEPMAAVRERLAMALDMALVQGQVQAEVNHVFHHAALLPLIEFCLQRGINTRFNRARLAEALWALERTDDGDVAAAHLLAEVGEMTAMQGVYTSRRPYRCHRIGLLAAKTRTAWRDAPAEVQRARADALDAEYAALLQHFGAEGADAWEDMHALRQDIAEYREHVQAQ